MVVGSPLIGVMYPGMSFPLLVNKEKIGIFKVLGTLPMTTGQITSGTKIMIWKGSDEKTVGETLYPPILHPVIATPLQMKMVDDPALSNVVGRASKMIGNFMSYYTHLPHEATKGKMTFLLHGPCDKKAVVEGIGRTLGLPVASVDASSLIKDFPSDSVSQINTCIQRPESRDGPLLIFLDRFDELVPHNRCGSTVMTDITTTQLKLLLDDPWVIFGHRITILVVSVRWINLICPTILSRIRTRFYCGNDEKEGDWDGVGMSLLKLLETNKSIDPNSRWVVTNAILYGNTSLSKSDVTKLFAATQSFDSIVIDAMQVLKDFKNTGSKAVSVVFKFIDSILLNMRAVPSRPVPREQPRHGPVVGLCRQGPNPVRPCLCRAVGPRVSDLFLRATARRPCIILIQQLDAINNETLISLILHEMNNMVRDLHVFASTRWWQLIHHMFLESRLFTRRVFCGVDSKKDECDFVGQALFEIQQRMGTASDKSTSS
uniref:ATPase AAA-type core domain-containing protein n=1 Tax=Oryza nivara TaxID=4536 RepID=A0A0E0GQ29_ORYNI